MPNRKKNYKDQKLASKTWMEQKRRYYNRRRFGDGRRRSWTDEEIVAVLKHEKSDTELAKDLGRSVQAVQQARYRFRDIYSDARGSSDEG